MWDLFDTMKNTYWVIWKCFLLGDSRQGPPGPPGPPGQPGKFLSQRCCCCMWIWSILHVKTLILFFLGYGRPGPKGDKGDSSFVSSAGGMIHSHNSVISRFGFLHVISSNRAMPLTSALFFLRHPYIQDHQDLLGLPGLKDQQVISLCEVVWSLPLY